MKRKIWTEVTETGALHMMCRIKGVDYALGLDAKDINPVMVKGLYVSMLRTIEALKNRTLKETGY